MGANTDGSVIIDVNLDIKKADRELGKLKEKIENTEKTIADLQQKRNQAAEKEIFKAAELDAEKAKLQEIKDHLQDLRMMSKDKSYSLDAREQFLAYIPSVKQELQDQQTRVRILQTEYNQVADSVEKYDQKIAKATSDIEAQKERAGGLQQNIEAENDRLQKIAEQAKVANRHVVQLNQELSALQERQKELSAAGVGFGYQEYDKNARRIAEITKELKEYQKGLRGEEGGKGKPEAQANRMAAAYERLNSILSKTRQLLNSGFSVVGNVVKSAGSAAVSLAKGTVSVWKNMNAITKLTDMLSKKFRYFSRMLKRTFMTFTILKGLRAIRKQITTYLSVNAELSTALSRLKGVFLTAFQPIYDAALPALISLVNVITKAVAVLNEFTAVLFGTTAKKAQQNASALHQQTKEMNAAGSAAEEAAKSFAGFDEINQLDTSKKGGGGGGGASTELGPSFDYEYEDTVFDSWGEAFSAFLDKLLDGIPKLRAKLLDFAKWLNDFAQKLYDMFTFPGVKEKVEQLGRDLAGALNELVNAIEWNLLGKALGAGLNLALQFLTEFLYEFDWINLGRQLAEFVNGLVSEIDWYDFGRLLWAGFKISLETLAGFLLGLDMPQLAEAASNIIKGFFDSMTETIEKIPWGDIGKKIAEFLNGIDWIGTLSSIATAIASGINAAITMLGTLVSTLEWGKIGAALAESLNLLISSINWPEMGETMSKAFLGALQFLYNALSEFDWEQFGKSIGEFLVSIDWHEILTMVFNVIWEAISGLMEGILAGIKTFWENADPFEKMLLGIAVAVGVVGAAITGFISIGTAAYNLFKALKTAISGVQLVFGLLTSPIGLVVAAIAAAVAVVAILITHFDSLKEVAKQAWEGIKNAFGEAAKWLEENIIRPIVDGYKEHIKPVLDAFMKELTKVVEEHVVPMAEKAIEFFGKVFEALKLAWDTVLSPLVSWIIENAIPEIGNALEFAGGVFNTLLKTVSDVAGGILEALGGVIDFVVGVFTGDWDRAWNGITDIFEGIWNAQISIVEGAVNLIIRCINFLIGALNALHIDIPDNPLTGPMRLGFNIPKIREISIPRINSGTNSKRKRSTSAYASAPDISTFQIPRLAQGAVIPANREFLAVLGDQKRGTNVEAPLATIEQALENVLSRRGNGGGATQVTVNFTGSLSQLARLLQPEISVETQRIGTRLVNNRA